MMHHRDVHPAFGIIHGIEMIFASVVLSTSITTLCTFSDWKEVRFTVAAAGWAVLSILIIQMLWPVNKPMLPIILVLEFLNWAMFLAVWIALAEQISCDTSYCSLPGGGHSHISACNTAYAALAFSLAGWVLFTISFGHVAWSLTQTKQQDKEKGERGNSANNA